MKNKIGVYICQCGSNISDCVDVEKVKTEAEGIKGVFLAKTTMFACSDAVQKEMVEDIINNQLDAIVVASCSPKLHLFTFRSVAERAGLNPHNYVQVNIREQCSWAHSDTPKYATEKAVKLVAAGISRVKHSMELESMKIPAENAILIIGAGISGMLAALELAKTGTFVYLIEREPFIGGHIVQWDQLYFSEKAASEIVGELYQKIIKHPNIKLYTGAKIIMKAGSVGNFEVGVQLKPRYVHPGCNYQDSDLQEAIKICPVETEDEFDFNITTHKAIHTGKPGQYPEWPVIDMATCTRCGECEKVCSKIDLKQDGEFVSLRTGAILVTTGFDSYEPAEGEFGYKKSPYIVTLPLFRRLIELNQGELVYKNKTIRNIAFIYCVGSRQPEGENKYCSRYCCTATTHAAILAKEKFTDIQNYHLSRGIRTYGKQEVLYNQATENGDLYFQWTTDAYPEIIINNDDLSIKVIDLLTAQKEINLNVDLIVLVTGMEPKRNDYISGLLKLPVGRDKFYNEIHPKLRPVETVIDGVFIAGTCQSPKNTSESVKSALAASSKINSLISSGEIELEPFLATIDKSVCEWCGDCETVCPFNAIEIITYEKKEVAKVNESNCKGCGMCLPVCNVNAIQLKGYSDIEIESMIEALI